MGHRGCTLHCALQTLAAGVVRQRSLSLERDKKRERHREKDREGDKEKRRGGVGEVNVKLQLPWERERSSTTSTPAGASDRRSIRRNVRSQAQKTHPQDLDLTTCLTGLVRRTPTTSQNARSHHHIPPSLGLSCSGRSLGSEGSGLRLVFCLFIFFWVGGGGRRV